MAAWYNLENTATFIVEKGLSISRRKKDEIFGWHLKRDNSNNKNIKITSR